MKAIASIMLAALLASGCGRLGRRDRIIQPEKEYPPPAPSSQPAESQRSPPGPDQPAAPMTPVRTDKASTAAATEPAEPSSMPSTGPSLPDNSAVQYKVIGDPEIIAAGMLQVNDKFITLDDILRPLGYRLKQAAVGATEDVFRLKALEMIRREIRRQMERTVSLSEAKRSLTDADKELADKKVEERFRQAITRMGGSQARLERRLGNEGTDLATWKEDLRQAMLVSIYMERHIGQRIVVSRREMWDHYVANKDEFRKSDRLQMQIISVPIKRKRRLSDEGGAADARREARELIDKAAAALAGGEDFAQVARTHSRGPMASSGGVWPVMERGSFRAEAVEETAFAQQPGKVSRIIETPNGFYIVKTLDIEPGEETTFEKVQEIIAQKLRRRAYEDMSREYMRDMRGKTVILAGDRLEQVAVDAAVRKYYRR